MLRCSVHISGGEIIIELHPVTTTLSVTETSSNIHFVISAALSTTSRDSPDHIMISRSGGMMETHVNLSPTPVIITLINSCLQQSSA